VRSVTHGLAAQPSRFYRYFVPGTYSAAWLVLYLYRIRYCIETIVGISLNFSDVLSFAAATLFLGSLLSIVLVALEWQIRSALASYAMYLVHSSLLSMRYLPIWYFHSDAFPHYRILRKEFDELLYRSALNAAGGSRKWDKEYLCHKVTSFLWLRMGSDKRSLLLRYHYMSSMNFQISFLSGLLALGQFAYCCHYAIAVLEEEMERRISLLEAAIGLLGHISHPSLLILLVLFLYILACLICNIKDAIVSIKKGEFKKPKVSSRSVASHLASFVGLVTTLYFFWHRIYPSIRWWHFIDIVLFVSLLVLHCVFYHAGCRDYHRFVDYYKLVLNEVLSKSENREDFKKFVGAETPQN